MGLFKKKKRKGFSDVIRCDESSYLIWKWRPNGAEDNSTKRENAIRYGSSLRVKEGEVAVFVYNDDDGIKQDFIEGPFDETIKTANFPVLASLVGTGFGGESPFQTEIYFINLAEIIQVHFAVPYFDVFDPRFLDFGVPVAVRGTISFKITDYKEFIKLHRLITFNLDDFSLQVKAATVKYIKGTVTNLPGEKDIPVLQIERHIFEINNIVFQLLQERFENEFGVTVSSVDIGDIECDKTSPGYTHLLAVTQDIITATTKAQTQVNIKQMEDMQRIEAEHLEETKRIQREESQRAQRLHTENENMEAHKIDQMAAVGIAGAESIGKAGSTGNSSLSAGGDAGSFNPGSIMAGMAIGGAVGTNVAGMMNNLMNNSMTNAVPPIDLFNVVLNGQATGPYNMAVLGQMVSCGQINKDSLVWKSGMSNWQSAGTVAELKGLFISEMPPVPPVNK